MNYSYTPTEWNNDGTPAISAENLNKIEQGINDAMKSSSECLNEAKTYSDNNIIYVKRDCDKVENITIKIEKFDSNKYVPFIFGTYGMQPISYDTRTKIQLGSTLSNFVTVKPNGEITYECFYPTAKELEIIFLPVNKV